MSGENPIPKAKPDDHEDVSWALSTAEATWNRGDRPDALKWLRRAAEAASEAEADDRALELAKAAAEVATNLEESRSESSSESIPISMSTGAPPPQRMMAAVTSPAFVPQRPPKPAPQKPPLLPNAKADAQKPKAAVSATAKAPKAAASSPSGARAPAKLILAPPSAPSDSQVLTPQAGSTGELPAARDSGDDLFRARPTTPHEESGPTTPRSKRNTQNPTAAPSEAADDEMDAWPTQSMSGGELPSFDNLEDKTRIGTAAYREPPVEPSARAPIAMRGIRPSQAVRVVVWRGPDGVHVAPHGTTVAAISVDAMLVALDPSADLSAWLANK